MILGYLVLAILLVAESSCQVAHVSPVVLNAGECPVNDTENPHKQSLKDEIAAILNSQTCSCRGGGSWRRVANLEMNGTSQQCPPNWNLITTPIRGCGRSTAAAGTCDSAFFQTFGRSYSRVCGRVIGYQRGSPNAFNTSINGNAGLESYYIDGISLTHGAPGRRQHIWSFVAAYYEGATNYRPDWACACTQTTESWPYSVPSFVGNNYFCATGNKFGGSSGTEVFAEDPLWDGKDCGPTNACCEFNNPPWFCTNLPQPTTDNLELRVCHDQGSNNEDVVVSATEIYIL